jgi:hypothetical protein
VKAFQGALHPLQDETTGWIRLAFELLKQHLNDKTEQK